MKKIIAGTAAVATIVSITACSPQPDVTTGGKNSTELSAASTEATKQEQPKEQKKFDANYSQDFKYVKLNVREIVITPDEVQVGLNYEASSSQKISWYPDQGTLVIGDMQLNADMLTQSNLVTGDISPGVKSDGALVFKPQGDKKIDVKKVTDLQFHLGEIFPEDLSTTKKVDFTVSVPSK